MCHKFISKTKAAEHQIDRLERTRRQHTQNYVNKSRKYEKKVHQQTRKFIETQNGKNIR